MSKNKSGKELTYEEIGAKLKISPQQVHKIEKEAFNKIIKKFESVSGLNIFDAIIVISQYLGIEPEQCYKKLDKDNHDRLCQYIQDEYGHTVKGFIPQQTNFKDLFH
jgi:DNA-directed RNA polymerase specialized sigma subunit